MISANFVAAADDKIVDGMRMCHRLGLPPVPTMGLGLRWAFSEIRVARLPARITVFTIGSISGDPAVVALLHGRLAPLAR